MLRPIVLQDGLSDQHVEEAAESPCEQDFSWPRIFARHPTTQAGQEVHLFPLQGDAQFVEEPCRYPSQSEEGAHAP